MLPLATTTVTVERPEGGDPYEPQDATTVSTGTPGHVSAPSGREVDRGGELEAISAVLLTDSGIDLAHTDLVLDEGTGERYRVAWVDHRRGLGLDHTKAGLVRYQGGANGG
jgi:hypothetical protein